MAENTQKVHEMKSLSLEQALKISHEALQLLKMEGKVAAIYICDSSKYPLVALTMKGTKLSSVAVAKNKAEQSAYTGKTTRFSRDSKVDPKVMGLKRVVPYAGGVPIYKDGVLVGGIGISNLHENDDENIAKEAVSKQGYQTLK